MDDLVTIIIPVYNGASVLADSVGDVFAQDYPAVELIAVNDGSNDGSAELLERLCAEAPDNVSMKVISQENGGICAARNAGIKAATGAYIAFMDQDDRIPSDYLSRLVNAMAPEDEMVIGGNIDFLADKGVKRERNLVPNAEWSMYRNTAPWGRLYRKDIIDEHGVLFAKTKISEDFYFNFLYLSYCSKDRVKIVPQSGYVWTIRKSSESHSNMSRIDKERDVTALLGKLMEDMLEITDGSALRADLFEFLMIKHIVWYLLFVSKGAAKQDVTDVYGRCLRWLKTAFPNYRKNPNLRVGRPVGEDWKISFIVRTSLMLDKMHLFLPFLVAR